MGSVSKCGCTWAGQMASHNLQAMQRSSPEGYLIMQKKKKNLDWFYARQNKYQHHLEKMRNLPLAFPFRGRHSKSVAFSLPRGLLPGSLTHSILPPIYSLSLLWTCLNHLSLAYLPLSPKSLTFAVLLMYSIVILSNLVTPKRTSASSSMLPPALPLVFYSVALSLDQPTSLVSPQFCTLSFSF